MVTIFKRAKDDAMKATPSIMAHETIQMPRNRLHIAGHSLKKCDNSTSFTVDAHCILYPVKCAHLRMKWDLIR